MSNREERQSHEDRARVCLLAKWPLEDILQDLVKRGATEDEAAQALADAEVALGLE